MKKMIFQRMSRAREQVQSYGCKVGERCVSFWPRDVRPEDARRTVCEFEARLANELYWAIKTLHRKKGDGGPA